MALGWLAMPAVFLVILYFLVAGTPAFITDNFILVWFVMVLVIMTASLGLLVQGLSAPKKAAKPAAPKKGDKGKEKEKATH
jgi:hypothetical protein